MRSVIFSTILVVGGLLGLTAQASATCTGGGVRVVQPVLVQQQSVPVVGIGPGRALFRNFLLNRQAIRQQRLVARPSFFSQGVVAQPVVAVQPVVVHQPFIQQQPVIVQQVVPSRQRVIIVQQNGGFSTQPIIVGY